MKKPAALLVVMLFILLSAAGTASAASITVPLSDFVIFSGGVGTGNTGGFQTWIGGHTVINGNIGSNQDLFLQGNPEPNYDARLNGSAYAGGDLEFGNDLIVGSSSALRDVVVSGEADIGGDTGDQHGQDFYGNLYANDVILGQNTTISGAVEYTNSYTPGSGSSVGSSTTPSSKTFALITMPAATSFTAGGTAQTITTGSGNSLTLDPGTYGALATSSQNQNVYLSSGNYYFDSITTQGGFDLHIDLSSGDPINIYVVGDVALAGNQTLLVKGTGTGGSYVPLDQASQLASLIYLETRGRFYFSAGGDDNSHTIWGGTVYASVDVSGNSPEISIGQYTDWYGAAWALDAFATADHGTWNHVPLETVGVIPEQSTLLLFGSGLIGIAAIGRKKLF